MHNSKRIRLKGSGTREMTEAGDVDRFEQFPIFESMALHRRPRRGRGRPVGRRGDHQNDMGVVADHRRRRTRSERARGRRAVVAVASELVTIDEKQRMRRSREHYGQEEGQHER